MSRVLCLSFLSFPLVLFKDNKCQPYKLRRLPAMSERRGILVVPSQPSSIPSGDWLHYMYTHSRCYVASIHLRQA